MDFLNSIPKVVFEIIALIAGFIGSSVLFVQVMKEYRSDKQSTLTLTYLIGWVIIYFFWSIYGMRFRAVALMISNGIATMLYILLLLIVVRKKRKIIKAKLDNH